MGRVVEKIYWGFLTLPILISLCLVIKIKNVNVKLKIRHVGVKTKTKMYHFDPQLIVFPPKPSL